MSFISKNLSLPYIAPAQAQKHVTHNEALRALDAVVHLSLVSKSQTTPPTTPTEGSRYFVAATGIDEWAGKDGLIAAYQDGAWAFYATQIGWAAWIEDESILQIWSGTAWLAPTPVIGHQNIEHIGINTTADDTNRFAVSSPAILLNHEGAGHQLKINKNAAGDTASALYQTGFSGRAEIGLTGDDDFHFKVSPDGSAWYEAIIIEKNSGKCSFPQGIVDKEPHPIMGNSGLQALAGETKYITHALMSGSQAGVYMPLPFAGTFSNMRIVTGGSPGPGAGDKWTFTLQDLFSDTALTCDITTGSNQGSNTTDKVSLPAGTRWCIKVDASLAVTHSGAILFTMDFESD